MPYQGSLQDFALFQQKLIGTWSNKHFPGALGGEGGPANPLSYNIMPLPQTSASLGYILKNFKYYERIRFHDDNGQTTIPVVAKAPNRGGGVTQNALAVFYDQQVGFAEGHDHNKIVHVENGTWITLKRVEQEDGPYPTATEEPEPAGKQQPFDITVAKQIAVPHGNSVLALGNFDAVDGSPIIGGKPVIPDAAPPYPTPVAPNPDSPELTPPELSVDPYTHTDADQNPHPDLTMHPNQPLQSAVNLINPTAYIHWHVTTRPLTHGRGVVSNIPFEKRLANVTDYWADYWLLSKDSQHEKFDFLAYTQTMLMEMIVGGEKYLFPHVTCNVITKD